MNSNGAFRQPSPFYKDFLALEGFIAVFSNIAYYLTVLTLLYFNCIRDFCEILIYITIKISERVIWTVEATGILRTDQENGDALSFRTVGTQTKLSVTEKTIQQGPKAEVNDFEASPISIGRSKRNYHRSELGFLITETEKDNPLTTNYSGPKERNEPAVLLINDYKTKSPLIRRSPQSPICRINLTPYPTNLRAKCMNGAANEISPDDRSCLKRKWKRWSLKASKTKQCSSMQSVNLSDIEGQMDEERRVKKAKQNHSRNCDYNRMTPFSESPEMSGCYKNWMLKLTSRFMRGDDGFASYKSFN